MKKILLFNILFCAFVGVGYAQTITVSPDVICAGGTSYIGTDTNLNYVHIGDIICVGNNSNHDTIIVRPEAWDMYSSSYTALSVVFYVDETGKHGWALGMPKNNDDGDWVYGERSWANGYDNLDCLTDYAEDNPREALFDLDGSSNTQCIRGYETHEDCEGDECDYPVVAGIADPFYVPAIGQINCLFPNVFLINGIISTILPDDSGDYFTFLDYSWWWSSTESSADAVFVIRSNLYNDSDLTESGTIATETKDNVTVVLPVMDF